MGGMNTMMNPMMFMMMQQMQQQMQKQGAAGAAGAGSSKAESRPDPGRPTFEPDDDDAIDPDVQELCESWPEKDLGKDIYPLVNIQKAIENGNL